MQTDEKMDAAMGLYLRIGVSVACAVMFCGGAFYLFRHAGDSPSYSSFHGEPAALTSIAGVFLQTRAGSARALIQLGALLMIATPVARVVYAVYAFACRRDWIFVAVSATVLSLLAFGLFAQH